MSITDELREFARRWPCTDYIHKDMLAIADSIDAEHERAMAAAALIAGVPITDENMAEHGWVRLPKDADGEYIHIGDRMENNERVARIVLTDDSWEPSVYLEKLPNVLHEYFCNEISHYHAPTVEDVLREFAFQIGQSATDDAIVAEYAQRLQLLEVDE